MHSSIVGGEDLVMPAARVDVNDGYSTLDTTSILHHEMGPVASRGGRYTGMNVTTSIMLCHDMDFAIPWIPLHIHGFHCMDRQRFFPRGHYCVIREREMLDRT